MSRTYIDSMILIMDNNDQGRYEQIVAVARQAVIDEVPGLTRAQYVDELKRDDRWGYVRAVGAAVGDWLAESFADATGSVDDWWSAFLTDVLDLHSGDVRDALGEHYLPDPDDIDHYPGDEDEGEGEEPPFAEVEPDALLADMRATQERIRRRFDALNAQRIDASKVDEENADDREMIAACFLLLDGWLSGGGALPSAWRR